MPICFNKPVVFCITLLKFKNKSFNLFIGVLQKFKLNVHPFYSIRFNVNELAGEYLPVSNTFSKMVGLAGFIFSADILEGFY